MSRIQSYIFNHFKEIFLYGTLAYFSYLMVLISLQYIPINFEAAFLRIKQDVIILRHYQIAFFVHVYTSVFALLAGFIQFSGRIRKSLPTIHRISGKIYVGIIVLFAAPSGIVMGYYANGGIFSQISFCILAILWLIFTYKAYRYAVLRKFKQHREFMLRSYALTLSAITLRLWKWILVYLFEPAPMDVYRIVAWMGWVLNLLFAEWYIRNTKKIAH